MKRKDWRGTPFEVGSTILYASHMGTRSWVTEAVIEEIRKDHLKVRPSRTSRDPRIASDAKLVKITAVDRITVI